MEKFITSIDRFFKAYERTFADSINGKKVDAQQIADCYTETFILAGPKGIMPVQNDHKFLESIPKTYDFYLQLGVKSMTIDFQEVTILDQQHAMVKIHWLSKYHQKANKEISIDYDVVYLIQQLKDTPRIFSFIASDEEKQLKESGLVS